MDNKLLNQSPQSDYRGLLPDRNVLTMFSPQPRPTSPFSPSSPPNKKLRHDYKPASTPTTPGGTKTKVNFFLPSERHTPIEQNVSYTRSYSSSHLPTLKSDTGPTPGSLAQALAHHPHTTLGLLPGSLALLPPPATLPLQRMEHSESDEDAHFLRLAREALVATASGVGGGSSSLVDPTIQDLLQRLQYASSPHGNPIKRSETIRANQNGQLMIQGFYQQFPNLSNDIFADNKARPPEKPRSNHPSSYSEGWNFLIGEPISLKGGTQYVSNDKDDDEDEDDDDDDGLHRSHSLASLDDLRKSDDPSRKFLCSKCSMLFRRSSDLKRHEKQHLTIPPNICELCGKGFARKDALKRHMGTMTCKRNAERKLYVDNLVYLENKGKSSYKDDWL